MKQNFTNLLSLLTRPNVNNLFLPHNFFCFDALQIFTYKTSLQSVSLQSINHPKIILSYIKSFCVKQFAMINWHIVQVVSNEFFAHLPTKLYLNENFAPKSMMLAELECFQRFLFKYFNFFSCLLSTLLVFQLYPFRF